MPLLFNKPVSTGYLSRLGLLPGIRKHYSQDTAAELSVRSAKSNLKRTKRKAQLLCSLLQLLRCVEMRSLRWAAMA
jgi:hypothetical protein